MRAVSWTIVPILLMAGCSGGEATSNTAPEPSSVVVADEIADGATLRGIVIDDSNAPVKDAQAFVKELDLLAQTDEAGGFVIQGIAEGAYTLFVSKLGYESAAKNFKVAPSEELELTVILTPIPIAEAFHETLIKSMEIQVGVSWAILGDFGQGCIAPGVTCQGVGISNIATLSGPNIKFASLDPKESPLATVLVEETWVANSAICAKAIQTGIYNPKTTNTANPSSTNPHYWTNYPHPTWKITSPVVMRIPRFEEGNPDSIDDPTRIERNDNDELTVKGDWTLRNFPPGKGLTNAPADGNCFTQQKIDIYWTNFYLEPGPLAFSARPDA
jgi:hypothetical protein